MKLLSAFACLALLAAMTPAAAFAQAISAAQTVASAPAAGGVIDQILGWVLAAVPGLVIAGWAWFKAHSAQSAAKWDDEAVAMVEKIAAGVVAKTAAPLTGADH